MIATVGFSHIPGCDCATGELNCNAAYRAHQKAKEMARQHAQDLREQSDDKERDRYLNRHLPKNRKERRMLDSQLRRMKNVRSNKPVRQTQS